MLAEQREKGATTWNREKFCEICENTAKLSTQPYKTSEREETQSKSLQKKKNENTLRKKERNKVWLKVKKDIELASK